MGSKTRVSLECTEEGSVDYRGRLKTRYKTAAEELRNKEICMGNRCVILDENWRGRLMSRTE